MPPAPARRIEGRPAASGGLAGGTCECRDRLCPGCGAGSLGGPCSCAAPSATEPTMPLPASMTPGLAEPSQAGRKASCADGEAR